MKFLKKSCSLLGFVILLFLICCRREIQVSVPPEPIPPAKELSQLGYTVQAGAFSVVSNAVRLTNSLNRQDLNAFYFVHESGLIKVRFGDFATREDARRKAEDLMLAGVLSDYFIVSPEEYAVSKEREFGEEFLRNELVETAKNFIGLPYAWGGTSPEEGFDCSGMTMAVYQLNGLNLPRSSREQWQAGTPIPQSRLLRGDLVFFDTSQRGNVTHVGIYTGQDTFIHAPGRNKKIRADHLSSRYFHKRFVGARSYLK
ncbi:MAG: C40 family peptidase [Candidatus Aminicenantes bacterium]|nr:C40 family peptidase [Candidatus Aminicenantes bacterium]